MPNGSTPKPRSIVRRRPQTAVEVATRHQVGVVYWVGVLMYTVGVITLLIGMSLALATLPRIPIPDLGGYQALATATTVSLRWTAPGDDQLVGQANAYDIRYSTAPITEANFSSATAVVNPPQPKVSGQPEVLNVGGLQANTTYYFALKTADEVPNWSALSNVASLTTTASACSTLWSCTDWSTCQNGAQTRRCVDTNACDTTTGKPVESQNCTETPPPGPCREDWSCTAWSDCTAGNQTRVCTDRNACDTTLSKPAESFDCSNGGQPPPVPGEGILAVIPARNAPAQVRLYTRTLKNLGSFFAFSKTQRLGGSVAVGDINGDGVHDILAGSGIGAPGELRAFSQQGKTLGRLFPFGRTVKNGLSVAAGDIDGDGKSEILVTQTQRGRGDVQIVRYDPERHVFSQSSGLRVTGTDFQSGLSLVLADMNNDGLDDLVVAPASPARPIVRLYHYDLLSKSFILDRTFAPFPSTTRTGLQLAVGDVDNDGAREIVVARRAGAPPTVRVFSQTGRLRYSFAAAASTFRGGVTLATLDGNLDGQAEIVSAVSDQGAPGVFVFNLDPVQRRFTRVRSISPYGRTLQSGLRLGTPH